MIAPQNEDYQSSPPDGTHGFRKCCEAIREAVPIQDHARRYTDLAPLGGQSVRLRRRCINDKQEGGKSVGQDGATMWPRNNATKEPTKESKK
jgi:hypothetical protein